MQVRKLRVNRADGMPLMAALPYEISDNMEDDAVQSFYDPVSQLTRFAGRRDFSTCREDESAGPIFSSKSDTQKDD